jgi:Type IV secretion-system coupling protein DNA-binding domain
VHTTRSETRRPSGEASTTTSEQRTIEPAFMASEIERLPDLTGFLKLASIPDWMRATLTHVRYPIVDRSGRGARDQPGAPADGGVDAHKRRGNAVGGE